MITKVVLLLSPEEAFKDLIKTIHNLMVIAYNDENYEQYARLVSRASIICNEQTNVNRLAADYCEFGAGDSYLVNERMLDEIAIMNGRDNYDMKYVRCYGREE